MLVGNNTKWYNEESKSKNILAEVLKTYDF